LLETNHIFQYSGTPENPLKTLAAPVVVNSSEFEKHNFALFPPKPKLFRNLMEQNEKIFSMKADQPLQIALTNIHLTYMDIGVEEKNGVLGPKLWQQRTLQKYCRVRLNMQKN